ncbi:hypothetical protein IPM62_06010 [Candidatus Woesebacteria bacterium]|nr:MAG: hypothetical protein IPM62_06010 [Candidatus Woesebacteria bacterium]
MDVNFNANVVTLIRLAAYVGLIFFTTVFVSLNFKTFKMLFKESTKSYWWLFLIISVIPLMILLSIFSLVFERKSPIKRIVAFKDGKVVSRIEKINFENIEKISPSEAFVLYFKNKNNKTSVQVHSTTPSDTEINKNIIVTPLPTTPINFERSK